MPASSWVRDHIRRNIYGLVALFIALGGSAIAAQQAARNSVTSKSIKNAGVKGRDVDSSQIQLRVGGTCPQGQSIRVVNVDGSVGCDSTSLALGGDLTGNIANAQIAPGVVGSPEVGSLDASDIADTNTLDGDEINEAGLTGVDAASVSGVQLGQFRAIGNSEQDLTTCEDDDENGEVCVAVSRSLDRPGRVLLTATAGWQTAAFDDTTGPGAGADDPGGAHGVCLPTVDGSAVAGEVTAAERQTGAGEVAWTRDYGATLATTTVTQPLSAGPHTFRLVCVELDGDIDWGNFNLSAVVLGNGQRLDELLAHVMDS